MRVIGIDPGIERTGFAVLEMNRGKATLLDVGCIKTDKKFSFPQRLTQLVADLKSILRQWNPVAASIEHIFFSKNVKTAIKVSHARGVILETLEDHGIAITELYPAQVKMAMTGDCRADKLQIKKMVQYTLGLKLKNDDAADAIACAMCLANINPSIKTPA